MSRATAAGSGTADAAWDAVHDAVEGSGVPPKAALCAALMTLLPRLSAQELATAMSGLSKLQVLSVFFTLVRFERGAL